jgi:predicted HD phosphohydrolase
MTFTRMDTSTEAEWKHIQAEHVKEYPKIADRVLEMLRSLENVVEGFAVNQLVHCLQTATLAEQAGADEEVVVASLCHDIGKAVSVANHGAIAAEMLKPYVRDDVYSMIRHHQDFQGRHYYGHFGMDPHLRKQFEGEPWFALAEQFADEWDQVAFDPEGETYPLEHFEPAVRRVFAQPRY